jgi:hypothetical protein
MRVSDWDDSPRTPDRVVGPSAPESRSIPIDPEIPQLLEHGINAASVHDCVCSDCRNRDSEAVPLRGSAEAPYAEVNCVGFTSAEASASVLSALGPTGHSFTLDNPRERYARPVGPRVFDETGRQWH